MPSIAREGFQPQRPGGQGSQAVFLTNDIETAAYYAAGSSRNKDYPVILEIVLTDNRRIKKLIHDPLDREYLSGGEYAEPDDYQFWDDDLNGLQNDIKNVLGITGYTFPITELQYVDDISSLDGFNIYKAIINYSRQNGIDVEEIKKRIQQYIPPSDYEYITIRPDGTLKLTNSYYDALHQMEYSNWIPAKAAKAVWVPEKLVRPLFKKLASDSKTFGFKVLSGDLGGMTDALQNISREAYEASPEKLEEGLTT